MPSGRVPSMRRRPAGSLATGISAEERTLANTSFNLIIVVMVVVAVYVIVFFVFVVVIISVV